MNYAGNIVAFGAPKYGSTDFGQVKLFCWNGPNDIWNNWGTLNGYANNDSFGHSISLNQDGSRLAVGAPYADPSSLSDAGEVRIYCHNGSQYVQLGTQPISGEVANDRVGYSLAINGDGNRVIVGAPFSATSKGKAMVYEYNSSSNTWIKLGQNISGENDGDRFGWSVSINNAGNRVVIGAPYSSPEGKKYIGQTYVYCWNASSWVLLGSPIQGENNRLDPTVSYPDVYYAGCDQAGYAVSMNCLGDRIAIGAYENDSVNMDKNPRTQANAGQVRIYHDYLSNNRS